MTRLQEVEVKEKRLHQLMDDQKLNGVLLKKQANFSWLTAGGYNMVGIASETGVTSLLVTKTGRYVIANRIEMQRMLVEEGLAELGFEGLEFEWDKDQELELVKKLVPDIGSVGVDMSVGGLRNMDNEIKKLRYVLTEAEVDRYRFLGAKLSAAVEKVMLGIRPGEKECEIAGRFGVELWKDRIDPTAIMVAADERVASYRHPIASERMIKRYVMASVNARYKGLITTITRILHFGEPKPELLKQFGQNLEIENRMIAATQVGKPMSAVFNTAVEAYRQFGFPDEWKLHHQGGSMGYYSRDIKVVAETTELVQENQAFCWNPSITGTKTEDGFIATSNGPVMITYPVIFPQVRQEVDGVRFCRPGMLVVS